ncbi:LCP family protein [Yinghuangia sp. ASG 101]|uniref:LCP family protein n=1 Tax=Yinghuangia sp. ASG 101 TaxID=2896848 RepID=UPI001E51B94A|nr:LCP family protein [Yinghuangia sp. ASG 101]UGQ09516.1 LCP family protein [Yinghuangia sp. ASG 101]
MNSWPPGWAEEDGLRGGPRRGGGESPPPAESGAPDADPTAVLPRDRLGRPISPPGAVPNRPEGTLPASGGAGPPAAPHAAPLPPDAQPTRALPGNARQGGYPPQPSPQEAAARAGIGDDDARTVPPRPLGRPGGPDGPDGPDSPGGPEAPKPPRGKPNWKKRVLIGVTVFLAVVLLFLTGTYFWLDSKIRHEDVLGNYDGRPAATAGTTWLIVGSDSREGLSDDEKREFKTGDAEGKRTDSMMLLHKGKGGTTLISLPRDSYVDIPAYEKGDVKVPAQKNKLNAAYAFGGAPLLARTVEMATGMRLDHYAEVGFGGFVGIVDSLDGVDLCLDKPIKDKKSGADLPAGCQTLNGKESLSFVRARYFDPTSDLGRMQRQQQFLAALAKKAKSPSVLLNPFKGFPMADAALSAVIVDNDTGLFDLYDLFKDMGSLSGKKGGTITVPIANPDYDPPGEVGSSVLWNDKKATALFDALREDREVPR